MTAKTRQTRRGEVVDKAGEKRGFATLCYRAHPYLLDYPEIR
ncbi:hypothetical protein [Providencia rettgeri]